MELLELLRYAAEAENQQNVQQQIQQLKRVDQAMFDLTSRVALIMIGLIILLSAIDFSHQLYLNRKINKRLSILESKFT